MAKQKTYKQLVREKYGLSVRAYRALFLTFGGGAEETSWAPNAAEIAQLTKKEFERIENVGAKTLKEIEEWIDCRGYSFRERIASLSEIKGDEAEMVRYLRARGWRVERIDGGSD